MSLIRFTLDLAIPEAVYNAIPLSKRVVIRDAVRALKAYAVKINAGTSNEEMTVKAKWHICHHDDPTVGGLYPLGKPCEPEREI